MRWPEHIPYPLWRIWQAQRATLHELETHWSIADVEMANEILDLETEAQVEAEQRARREAAEKTRGR